MRRFLPPIAIALLLAALPATAGASRYVIKGHGDGHGIGMSQWGAYGFAKHGWTYAQILGHYYKATTIGSSSGRQVRVLLQSGRRSVSFAGATRAGSKKLSRGKTYTAKPGFGSVVLRQGSKVVGTFDSPLRVTSSARSFRLGGGAINGISGGAYRGALELREGGGSLMSVNALSADDYVKGVVPGEVSSSWPAESLKAQAVAARSYGLSTHASTAFDQYPDTRSQVYRGMSAETGPTNAAVAATAGQVVRYGGRIAVTYFFAASGGRTENVENVFYGSPPAPYLKSVKDPYEKHAPRHTWKLRFTKKQVAAKLGGLVKGNFRGIKVVKRGRSPRVVWADVIGSGGRTRVRGATLKARLGLYDTWATFPSLKKASSSAAAPAEPAGPAPASPQPAPAPSPAARSSAPAESPSWRWPAEAWRSRVTP